MAKWLGIDYGLERCGLAISDPAGTVVLPVATIGLAGQGSRKAVLDAIAQLALARAAEGIVMGLPLYEDGRENETCAQVRNAARRLKRRLALPFYFMPELLSSFEAAQLLGRHKKSIKKGALDQLAACRILQSFLAQPCHCRLSA